MTKVRVNNFSVSVDGYGAGPSQDVQNPLGVRGDELHEWVIPTKSFRSMKRPMSGETGIDDDFSARSMLNLGAWIMGRNMFGPVRGPWPDDTWHGWWGDEPPYHTPVFVLTHHARAPVTMKGNTTFHFVTGGIHEAMGRAREAAGGKDIRIGGGVSVLRQYLSEKLIDEVHLAMAPTLLGAGEHLFAGLNLAALGYKVSEHASGKRAMHVVFMKS